ncbi:hypothetical protein NEIPOLOT_00425 [Neisseria polysaccharea ATCC 43768]|nr:hypothetical protein NEIPOLOT_00425 [Neisseria polysaccharea ATCC 43768]
MANYGNTTPRFQTAAELIFIKQDTDEGAGCKRLVLFFVIE